MSNKYLLEPQHIGYSQKKIICDYCGNTFWESNHSSNKKKKHFCNQDCYSKFRSEKMSMEEQPAYKGIRKQGDTLYVYHRRYVKANPERIAHLKARRYAREKGAIGNHTLEEWNNLKEKFNNKCAFCNKQKRLTKDHIMPLSEGGSDYIENIQPLCRNCNSRKWKSVKFENPELLEDKK